MSTTLSKPAIPAATPPASRSAYTAAKATAQPVRQFLFDKSNYRLMLTGIALILLGFFLMAGGKSPDPHQFNDAEVYSFRRITLAPIVMLIGFALEAWAILKKPVQHNAD